MAVAVSGLNPGGVQHAHGGRKCARLAAGTERLVPTDRLDTGRSPPEDFGGGVELTEMDSELAADADGVAYLPMKSLIEWLDPSTLNFSTKPL